MNPMALPASPVAPSTAGAPPGLDAQGRYASRAPVSTGVVVFYGILVAILLWAWGVGSYSGYPYVFVVLIAILMVFLARYASTRYVMDSDFLTASRLFGSRRVRLEEVRGIELANLRDLGPVSFFGGWGWRGRVWSPTIGTFDSIHTVSPGVLVSVGAVPLFVSPRDPVDFARELSRRVRSYHELLDPAAPGAP